MPPGGTEAQRERLAELAYAVAVEGNPARRAALIGELGVLHNDKMRTGDTSQNDARSRYIVRVAYNAYEAQKHMPAFSVFPPTEITSLPQYLPQELVALRVTRPRDWPEELHRDLAPHQNNTLAEQMIVASGALDTVTGIPLGINGQDGITASDQYDGLVALMYRRDPIKAATYFLPRSGSKPGEILKPGEMFEREMQMHDLIMHWRRLGMRERERRLERHGPTAMRLPGPYPYDETAAEMMLRLADRSEWPVHLFVVRQMLTGPNWRDDRVIRRLAEHEHPVTMRFLRAHHLIDEQGNPVPHRSVYVPDGFRRPDPEPAGPE